MKRTIFFSIVAVLTVFTGCQKNNAGGYLRFAWWGNATRDERTNNVAKLFMEKNPGLTIETEPVNWDGYWPKLNTQAAAGSLPDVMQQDYMYIGQYNDRNQLVDMENFVNKGVIDLSQWPESAVASGRLNGKLIALNLGTNAWGMGVDKAVLDAAGVALDDTAWTWKDFEQIAITVYQKTGVKTMPINEFHQGIEHVVRQYGRPFFAADGKSLGWTDMPEPVRELFDMQLRIKAAGALYDPNDAFIQGRAFEEEAISKGAAWNGYYWSNQHIGHINAAKRPLEYVIFPTAAGNKAPFGTYLKPSMFISILASSKNQDTAARFVNFFINDLEANRILLAERGIPVSTAVRNDLAPRVDPNMKTLFDYITRVTPYTSPIDPPDPSRSGEVRDAMRPIILQCLTGALPSDAAVTQMIQAANTVLGR